MAAVKRFGPLWRASWPGEAPVAASGRAGAQAASTSAKRTSGSWRVTPIWLSSEATSPRPRHPTARHSAIENRHDLRLEYELPTQIGFQGMAGRSAVLIRKHLEP